MTGVQTCALPIFVDFEKDRLPFEDNTVEYVFAMHILEHIGDGFFHLMQEIYRVCHHSAILRVVGPHHRHDDFFMDPTHKRPINHSIMQHFDKAWCDNSIENVGSSSGMANVYKVDIRMPEYEYTPDPYYQPMFDDMKMKFEKKVL